jgi:drug/metabolite transporter (DMT)-like permease
MKIPEPVLWLSMLNATLCTFAPVVMVMMAIERIGASLTAQTGAVGPVSTILLSVVLLGEPLTGMVALGSLLVLLGIGLLARQLPPAARDSGAN